MIRRFPACFQLALPMVLMAAAALAKAEVEAEVELRVISGAAFEAAVPRDFYLEGNAIPVEKRNAVLLKSASGKHLLVALLDTSGYSSQVQGKYAGMLIAEAPVRICGIALAAGSYGFGLRRPERSAAGKAELTIYDQGGELLGGCTAVEDAALEHPVPLRAVPEGAAGARMYLGRYYFSAQLAARNGVAR